MCLHCNGPWQLQCVHWLIIKWLIVLSLWRLSFTSFLRNVLTKTNFLKCEIFYVQVTQIKCAILFFQPVQISSGMDTNLKKCGHKEDTYTTTLSASGLFLGIKSLLSAPSTGRHTSHVFITSWPQVLFGAIFDCIIPNFSHSIQGGERFDVWWHILCSLQLSGRIIKEIKTTISWLTYIPN